MRYLFVHVAIFHGRVLSCGVWVGKHREVFSGSIFVANSDFEAQLKIRLILDPHPKLQPTPGRTVKPVELVEIDKEGNKIRVVKDWEYKRSTTCCGGLSYKEPSYVGAIRDKQTKTSEKEGNKLL